MTRTLALFYLPFLTAAASPPDPQTMADARCVMAMGSELGNENPQAKQLALTAMLYFLGRIDGRTPEFDMKAAWDAEMKKKIAPKEWKALVDSCIDQVQKRLSHAF